ncbi:MAG: hypothetical protein PHH11_15075 [Methylomonas sp.]|nr:hypothetical protein [Methylomonas sp.]
MLPGGEDIPILALTASAFAEDRNQVLAAGCNDILSKPVEAQLLFGIIGCLLGLQYQYECPRDTVDGGKVSLEKLPLEWRKKLAEAAVILDNEAVLAVVDGLRQEYPAEAGVLAGLLDEFRFDAIQALYSD